MAQKIILIKNNVPGKYSRQSAGQSRVRMYNEQISNTSGDFKPSTKKYIIVNFSNMKKGNVKDRSFLVKG